MDGANFQGSESAAPSCECLETFQLMSKSAQLSTSIFCWGEISSLTCVNHLSHGQVVRQEACGAWVRFQLSLFVSFILGNKVVGVKIGLWQVENTQVCPKQMEKIESKPSVGNHGLGQNTSLARVIGMKILPNQAFQKN